MNGHYGAHKEFKDQSLSMTFDYNEGLPGKTWTEKHPIILTSLEGSFFKRIDMVKKIGLTTAIAIPIFAGELVVFFMWRQ